MNAIKFERTQAYFSRTFLFTDVVLVDAYVQKIKHCTTRTEITEYRIKWCDLTNEIDWDIQNEQHEIYPHAKIQLVRKLLVKY